MDAVVPPETVWVPAVEPSRVKVMVPEGVAVLEPVSEMVAVTRSGLPPSGVVVAGARASEVATLAMVIVTEGEVTLV